MLPAALACLAVPVAGLAFARWLEPTLPAQVGSHWGFSGPADGFSSPLSAAVVAVILAVLAAAAVLLIVPRVDDPFARRAIAAVAAFVPAALGGLSALSLLHQSTRFSSIADPARRAAQPLPGWTVPAGMVLAAAAAVGAGALVPRSRDDDQVVDPAERAAERAAERDAERDAERGPALWEGRASTPFALVFLAMPTVLLLALGLVTVINGGGFGFAVGLLAFVAVIDLVVAALLFIRVRVDRAGLVVSSSLPVLRDRRRLSMRVRLRTIESVCVVAVRPVREFGGWGYRIGRGGRVGFVVRSGPALEVLRRNGSRFIVTVDDAQGAADALRSLLPGGTRPDA